MKTIILKLRKRIDQWIAVPGMTPESFAIRKLILSGLTSNFFGSLLMVALAWHWDLPRTTALLTLLPILIALSLAGIYFQWLQQQDMYFLIEIWSILFAFTIIVTLGGIAHSGGFLLLGITAVMTSVLLKEFKRIQIVFGLFLVTVLLAGLLQTLLDIPRELSPKQNLLFFVLLAIGFTGFTFQFNRTFWEQRLGMEQLKTRHLKELDTLKTRFYTNISHEFRTPLTVILGLAQQIRETPTEWYLEGTELIERNGQRLLRLVNQILDLAKLESGSLPVHYRQTDVIHLLRYLLESYHVVAEEKQIDLELRSEPDALLMDLDLEKMEQIISNLVTNALKHTPQGGRITLHVRKLGIKESPFGGPAGPAPCLCIDVEDTGSGIDAAHLERVFDRFFQAGGASLNGDTGTGLGLSITREYVRCLDGTIDVISEKEKGTIFSIHLPIHQNAPLLAVPPPPGIIRVKAGESAAALANKGKSLLLIIEDNEDVVRFLQIILQNDYRLLIARDGQQGIEQALNRIPDLIISDVMMPRKDGFQVCRTLKNDYRTNHIPIILLTAKSDRVSRITGLQEGADAYLAKPFNRDELTTELQRLIRLRKVLRAKYTRHPQFSPASNRPSGLNDQFLYDVHQVLERHYADEDFGIRDLCRKMKVSRTQLHRKLVALTGQSASHYIRAFRLQKALPLLRTTRKTVAEVAYAVGFKDPNYFSRAFTQAFGQPPAVIRI